MESRTENSRYRYVVLTYFLEDGARDSSGGGGPWGAPPTYPRFQVGNVIWRLRASSRLRFLVLMFRGV